MYLFYLDWRTPTRGISYPLNMERKGAALQIKTDSTAGSGDLVFAVFVDVGIFTAGVLKLHFTNPMQYELDRCTETRQPLSNVPVEQDKIWTVYRIRTFNSVKIECNGVVVADFNIASCTHGDKEVYNKYIARFIIQKTDTATDFFRQKGLNPTAELSHEKSFVVL